MVPKLGKRAGMPASAPARPQASGEERTTPRSHRWHSLDVLKGLALFAMVAHHFQKWAAGQVDGRFIGFDHYVVTDLAAPLFAVALGAGAVVVGARVERRQHLPAPLWRWGQIFLIGLAIDFATHDFRVRGTGVLPTLAILGALVMLAVFAGLRAPAAWWGIAGLCAVAAVPATDLAGESLLTRLVAGPFALPVYGVFAAAGAAVACHGLGREEGSLPLWRATVGVLAVGVLAAAVAGGVVAPKGIWPPARYPGHLGFTLWGLVASFGIWAAARWLLPAGRLLGEAMARAGRRTLYIFAAHFIVKIILGRLDLIGELDTRAWGLVTWAAVALVCVASTIPSRSSPTPVPASS